MGVKDDQGALRVLLQFLRAREAGDPFAFCFEPQDYILPTEGGESPTARFDWTEEVMADLQAVRLPGRDPAIVQRLGGRLRRFVRDAGWQQHEQRIAEALDEQRPVVLTIRSSAAELYALPWELLTLKSGQFMGEVDGLLIRFEWPDSPSRSEHPQPRAEGGRILVAWSAAAGAVPTAEHVQSIAAACAAGVHPWNAETDVLAHASIERIVERLEAAQQAGPPIHVLHLLCHGAAVGSTFGLCLDGEDGTTVVNAAQLRQHLAPFAKMVRLIVLSACDSGNAGAMGSQLGSVAQTLHRCGFQSVIASRYPLTVAGSCTLTKSFYTKLLSVPASLESAFLAARKRLALSEANLSAALSALDWASMQLYARHADGDDTRPIVFRPFRGLLAFQPEHRRFFFGRNKEIQEILTDMQMLVDQGKARLLVVAGGSGTGKSSLVLAGAVPKILAADPALLFLRMRPGPDPELALNEALSACPAGAQALLVVDQFEEVFTQTASPAAREAFVRRLWELAGAPAGLRVILTMRVDFIGRCGELIVDSAGLRLDRIAYDEAHRLFIAQLEPEQLRAAIIEPARKVGLELQAGLAERILNEVGREPGALPLMQDALDVLWQRREGNRLTQAAYDELGGVVGSLKKRADTILDTLAQQGDQEIARRLLVSLVAVAEDTALDTRLRVPLSDLRAQVTAEQGQRFDRVLKDLVSARLLVQDGDGLNSTVEVAHEALIRKWPRLRAWLDEDRAGLVMKRRVKQAAQQWEEQGRDTSLLYRGTQLAHAQDFRKTWEARLGTLERAFLDHSETQRVQQEAEEAERQRREREAVERIKQKSIEVRDALLVAAAQAVKDDPTAVAALLREVAYAGSRLWMQSALDVLQAAIAESVLRGHQLDVYAVAWSRDGTRIATGSADKTVRIWHLDGTGPPTILRGHRGVICAVAFSPDGTKIASCSDDQTARLWSADGSGEPIVLQGHHNWVHSVAWSHDGRKLATGGADRSARIWNADGSSAAALAVLRGHDGGVVSVAWSPDGTRLVCASEDKTVRVFNVGGASPASADVGTVVLKGHEAAVTSVVFNRNGTKIASGSADQTVRIWNADGSGVPVGVVLKGHERAVYAVAFSPDGRQVISASGDKTARIWNADGSGSPRILQGHKNVVTSVAFAPDGRKVVTGSVDYTARIWSTRPPDLIVATKALASEVLAVAFSPDGTRFAAGCRNGITYLYRTGGVEGGPDIIFEGHASGILRVAFSPDGKRLVTISRDMSARIWSADSAADPVVLTGTARGDRVGAVAFCADGTQAVAGSRDALAWVANPAGSEARLLQRHNGSIVSVAFRPDVKRIVTCSDDGSARVFNADGSGTPIVLQGHEAKVLCAAFSPDGKRVVTGSADRTARIWNADGSGSSILLRGHESELFSVTFSPDGTKVVTGSADKTARLWNADDHGAPVVLKGHEGAVTSVCFSPDGKQILTGSVDKTVRIFLVASDALLSALWEATTDCLPAEERRELLGESPADAEEGLRRSRQEVARRRSSAR